MIAHYGIEMTLSLGLAESLEIDKDAIDTPCHREFGNAGGVCDQEKVQWILRDIGVATA
jgi:hypothetical protein